jgi:hypothetical protein
MGKGAVNVGASWYKSRMQLVEVGRNDPCPCSSGRKYKKCCLGAREEALVGTATDIDVTALVVEAMETDDWSVLHDLVDHAIPTPAADRSNSSAFATT